ncbi:DsbA family oxidoreductase [Chryseolinea lacunae]|uniref:DsbA family oxidoreductase n=1 Tax=Chryseolinea lacunae TaxID=2801331 RepID=A0ABS1KPB0_9BACT|nr:DsbA family oxidoreductase [Chryseolinea lacunae]MBL0741299.1 DsbA family oxidoreductase [Chryseolinea lacunae]
MKTIIKPVIRVDIVSDVVCPWCYIGKRRIEKAMAEVASEYDFDVHYLPFELNPGMPAEGANQKEYLANKFGSESKYHQITQHVTGVAKEDGLAFDFSRQTVSPNTRKAHSLIQAAANEGKQLAMTEAFFKAYFTEGVDLSKSENLVAVAVGAGMSKETAEAVLADTTALEKIEVTEKEMSKLGISGVPFYIINNRYGVSGAQPSDAFVQAFAEIGTEMAKGAACDVDGTNC